MKIGELLSIKTLENDLSGTAEKRTRYRDEIRLFSCVQQGDIKKLIAELQNLSASIITGRLSNNSIMQYKYIAVSTITLATRYAIQGGLNEKSAYDFSDSAIIKIDGMNSADSILNFLANEIIRLTKAVGKSKSKPSQSPHVRKCICYINENINEKITVSMLSEICGISPDYLSQLFKNEMGENLSAYITRKKLEIAKELIMQKKSCGEICCRLGFSSQSHFITVFKKYFHMTPTEYYKLIK